MNNNVVPKARKENLVVQELNGEILIYDLDKNKAFCLNETSSLVWQLCDGNNTISEISESVSRKLDSPANEDFVWLALDQLKKEKLIANSDEVTSGFAGMSRREVVKKIGLGTMIALPLVSSLIAPPAISASSSACLTGATSGCTAGSGRPINCVCSNDMNCASGNCSNNPSCTGANMACAA